MKIKKFELKTEEPGAGIEVQLENKRILFVDVYQFLQFLADRDESLFIFLYKQKQLQSAVEEMVFLYELGIPFDEWLERLIQTAENETPGWILDASYPIFDGED